jgi:hypothetical protein
MIMTRCIPFFVAAVALLQPSSVAAQVTSDAPAIRPDAIVNLATDEGVALVKGQWRYSDARVVVGNAMSPMRSS